ncbi:restriction endonuclease [Kitasatospora arboriphila]|uniref:restriction endonuclease n=1 Tax=Kitasatospora arboriphila TaxID=258052 RepID=UPI0031D65C24
MPRRPRGWRRLAPRTTADRIAAGVVAAVALILLTEALRAAGRLFAAAWPLLAAVVVMAAAVGAHRLRQSTVRRRAEADRTSQLRLTLAAIDAMTDHQFEFAARDLLLRDGCTSARQVGRQGDQAADVIAHHPAHGRIVIQCKHTKVAGKVGAQVMYQVKGTAGPVHHADIAVVVTNGTLTRDAATWGNTHGIHWIDRDRLRRWAEDGVALADLLGLAPRVRALRSAVRSGAGTAR